MNSEFMRYTPEQLAHILDMLIDSHLDAWIINQHTDEPILPQEIKQSGMVYIQIGEKRFPCLVVVAE